MWGFIPNPWVIIGFLALLAFSVFTSYEEGKGHQATVDQLAWKNAEVIAQKARGDRIAANKLLADDLQAKTDKSRKEDHEKIAVLDSRLVAANNELRNRPSRPVEGGAAPVQAAVAGPQSWCTGAGLYADDGLFLTGKADLFERIRLQRDSCYASYERAQEAVAKLKCQ